MFENGEYKWYAHCSIIQSSKRPPAGLGRKGKSSAYTANNYIGTRYMVIIESSPLSGSIGRGFGHAQYGVSRRHHAFGCTGWEGSPWW